MKTNNYIVYAHVNKQNGKSYIGITNRSPIIRWGKEGNGYKSQPKFYQAIQKYGWGEFTHLILAENLTEEEALDLETYYIKEYNSIQNGYNILLHGIQSYHRCRPVFCLTTQTKYSSIKEAAIDTDTLPSRIIQNCKGLIGPVKGNQWTYWNQEKNIPEPIHLFVPKKKDSTAIYCLELKKFFESVSKGAKYLGVNEADLGKVLNLKRNGIQGLHFIKVSELSKENILTTIKKKTGKAQKIYCQENGLIYNSLQEAALFCNKTPQTVMKNCQGKLYSCNGYHFQYLQDVKDDILIELFYPKETITNDIFTNI